LAFELIKKLKALVEHAKLDLLEQVLQFVEFKGNTHA
jgi:hypothetical protein